MQWKSLAALSLVGAIAGAGAGLAAATSHIVGAAPATPAPVIVPAGHAAVGRAALEDRAKNGRVWCQDWRPSDGSCGGVAFLDTQTDGAVRETVWFRLSDAPDVIIGLRDNSDFEGDALCSTNNSKSVQMAVEVGGKPATGAAAFLYERAVRGQIADDDGKHSCESFFQGPGQDDLISTVTTDGAHDPKLDSTYHLLPAGAAVTLRASDDGQAFA